jgi:predicted enzyme related to lactoylglutathione lyase
MRGTFKKAMLLCVGVMVCAISMVAMPVWAQQLNVFQQPGAFSWYELMTTDVDEAVKFYTQLFGWTTTESQLTDGGQYIALNVAGADFGGIMNIPPQAQGAPPYWGLYVTVTDIEAAVKQAQASGGTVLVQPTTVEGSQFAVLQDPQGAVFSVMTYAQAPETQATVDIYTQHGAISWPELMTTDLDAAVSFYTKLFGWTTEETLMENGERYITVKVAELPVGGISKLPPQTQNIPPYWGLYVTVTDVDASATQAQELGAQLFMPPMDVPNIGRFCVIQDPQGAFIALMTYANP